MFDLDKATQQSFDWAISQKHISVSATHARQLAIFIKANLAYKGMIMETCNEAVRRDELAKLRAQGCDCQNPPPEDWDSSVGPTYHCSNSCPIHNLYPEEDEE